MEIERTGSRLGDAAVVDTPGLNALDTFHERVTREFVEEADAIIWIFSATRGGAASEGSALKSVSADGRQVLGVLNKVDTLDPGERAELVAYLREQFGEILLDVIADLRQRRPRAAHLRDEPRR
jgi:predicted GTPase